MDAVCRFCGARLLTAAPDFGCPLCGGSNRADQAPVRLEWDEDAFARRVEASRVNFDSRLVLQADQCAALRLDGRVSLLKAGEHRLYPADPDGVRVTFADLRWREVDGAAERELPISSAAWQLRVVYRLEGCIEAPETLLELEPFESDLAARIKRLFRQAAEATIDAELNAALSEDMGSEEADDLKRTLDAALSRVDAEAVNRELAADGHGFLKTKTVSAMREMLAMEAPDGEPCSVCGRKNPRADGTHRPCDFCGTTLFWCERCHRHVLRRDDRWCAACGGRIYA